MVSGCLLSRDAILARPCASVERPSNNEHATSVWDEAVRFVPHAVLAYAAVAGAFLLRLRLGLAAAGASTGATVSAGAGFGASVATCSTCASSTSIVPW